MSLDFVICCSEYTKMNFDLVAEKSEERQRFKGSELLDYVNQNRIDGYFNDVTLKTGQKSIPANRLVLSCYSKFFETMFRTEMQEKYERNVEISSVNEQSLTTLIEFMYTGKMIIDNKNVLDLLSAADYLLMDKVKQYCVEFLVSIVSPNNCLGLLRVANLYNSKLLSKKVFQTIDEDFDAVVATEDFNTLSKLELISVITNRNHAKGASIYNSLVTWTEHDEMTRAIEFVELFSLLKLHQLPSNFMVNTVLKGVYVKDNLVCLNLVKQAWSKIIKDKKIKESGSKIICLDRSDDCLEVKEIFNLLDEPEIEYPDLENFDQHQSIFLNNTIYSFGGTTKKVWRLNLLQNELTWEEIQSMNRERTWMGVALYQDTIVVAGGLNSQRGSAEIYLTAVDEWKNISRLNEQRMFNELVSCDDCLFCIGGIDNMGNVLSSVEKLSSLKSKWEYVAPMLTPRKWFAAVACNGFIYAIGGQSSKNNSSRLRSVEKYDSEKDEWSYVSTMISHRSGHAACVLQNKIYVVGGGNGDSQCIYEIECFDPETNEWSEVDLINQKLVHGKLFVV